MKADFSRNRVAGHERVRGERFELPYGDAMFGVARVAQGDQRTGIDEDLPRHTVVRVEGAIRDWYRVQVPDGTSGFVSERLTQSTRQPLRTARASAKELLDRPIATAAPIANLDSTLRLPVLGRFHEFLLVRIPDGREGWIVSTTEAS